MRGYSSILALVVFVTACRHISKSASRAPAQSQAMCGEDLERETTNVTQALKYMQLTSASAIGKILLADLAQATSTTEVSCNQKRVLENLKLDINTFERFFTSYGKSHPETSAEFKAPLMSDLRFIDRAVCFAALKSEFRKRPDLTGAELIAISARKCGFKGQDWINYDNDSGLQGLLSECRFTDSGEVNLEELRLTLEKKLPAYRNAMFQVLDYLESGTARLKLVKSKVRAEKMKISRLEKSYAQLRCEPEALPPQVKVAEAAVKLIRDDDGRGTMFYAAARTEGVKAVTAFHVYRGRSRSARGLNPRQFLGAQKTEDQTFVPRPDKFSVNHDFISEPVERVTTTLKFIGSESMPKTNQVFYIMGYPANREANITSYTCRFIGFAPSLIEESSSTVYLLRCSGAAFPIEGMSGGPLLDEEGRVWGVISSQEHADQLVYVSPVSENNRGEIISGIQIVANRSDCISPVFKPYNCQVSNRPFIDPDGAQ